MLAWNIKKSKIFTILKFRWLNSAEVSFKSESVGETALIDNAARKIETKARKKVEYNEAGGKSATAGCKAVEAATKDATWLEDMVASETAQKVLN